MITLNVTQNDIDELNYLRFYHPDPTVMKRCETVYLKAKSLKTGQIRELTGFDVKTIRTPINLYKNGGIEALKHHDPHRPQSELDEYKLSVEQDFKQRPPASSKEAGERIFKLTGVRRGTTQVKAFMKRLGLKFRNPGGIPAKANLVEQEEFLKKTRTCDQISVGRMIATVFHGRGSLCLGNGLFDGTGVFCTNVYSNLQWSQALQCARGVQCRNWKAVDGGQ